MLSAALLLGGCSKEPNEILGGTEEEPTAITVSVTLPVGAAEASTKAVADGSTALTLSFARADESAAGTWGPYGTTALKATRTGGSGEQPLTFDPVQYYLTDGLKTRMAGWYPGGAAAAGSPDGFYDAAAGTINWTIDGGQDILLAAPREGSKTAKMPVFEFRHALAQVQFLFYAESEEAKEQWGKILGVAVRGQRAAAAFTPAGATDDNLKLTFTGDATETFAAANFAEMTAPAGTKEDAVGGGDPVMIEPQETPCRLTVEVTTEKQGVQTAVVSERSYTAGEAVKICIRLAEQSVTIDPEGCEITPWSGVTQTGDNEIDNKNNLEYPYVLDGRTIVMSDAFGAANPTLYPLHEPWTSTPYENYDDTRQYNNYGAKFEVARENCNSTNMPGVATQPATTDKYHVDTRDQWCSTYSQEADGSDAGAWRVPTTAEGSLIGQWNKQGKMTALTNLSGNVYINSFRWGDPKRIGYVDLATGDVNNSGASEPSGIGLRCVRDLVRFPYVVDGNTIVISNRLGAAYPAQYPTHSAWTTTPAHSEAAWNANESGNNTYGKKFRIASSDAKGKDGSAVTMTWFEASSTTDATNNPNGFSACAEYSEASDQSDKGQWRLPTIRELKLIYDRKDDLTANNVFGDAYWSATEHYSNSDAAWYISFSSDRTVISVKSTDFRVRCVRDL